MLICKLFSRLLFHPNHLELCGDFDELAVDHLLDDGGTSGAIGKGGVVEDFDFYVLGIRTDVVGESQGGLAVVLDLVRNHQPNAVHIAVDIAGYVAQETVARCCERFLVEVHVQVDVVLAIDEVSFERLVKGLRADNCRESQQDS